MTAPSIIYRDDYLQRRGTSRCSRSSNLTYRACPSSVHAIGAAWYGVQRAHPSHDLRNSAETKPTETTINRLSLHRIEYVLLLPGTIRTVLACVSSLLLGVDVLEPGIYLHLRCLLCKHLCGRELPRGRARLSQSV